MNITLKDTPIKENAQDDLSGKLPSQFSQQVIKQNIATDSVVGSSTKRQSESDYTKTMTNRRQQGPFDQLFNQEINQDSCEQKLIMEQHRLIELARLILIAASVVFSTISFTVNFRDQPTFTGDALLIYLFLTTVILEILTFLTWFARFRFEQVTHMIPSNQSFFISEQFLIALFECACIICTPNPWSQQTLISLPNSTTTFYRLNELLTMLLYQRMFLAYFIALRLTDYYTSSVTRVGKFYSVKWNTFMVFKVYFRDFPIETQASISATAIFYSTLMFWVSERAQARIVTEDSLIYDPSYYFYSFQRCVYITFISFFGVGYGEIAPDTEAGRIVQIFCCFMGLTTTSLAIVNLMNTLEPNDGEFKTISVIERIKIDGPIRKASALVVDILGFLYKRIIYFRLINQIPQPQEFYQQKTQMKQLMKSVKQTKRTKKGINGESVSDIVNNNMTFIKGTMNDIRITNDKVSLKLLTALRQILGQPIVRIPNERYLQKKPIEKKQIQPVQVRDESYFDFDLPIGTFRRYNVFSLVSKGQTSKPNEYVEFQESPYI